ncbi:MAG: cell division protein FtsZ [Prevotellaceae bacterium]|jgi:cell division protein FtsZ|nr:cell division protein FtsZ [Prevotellaceae bacterium]
MMMEDDMIRDSDDMLVPTNWKSSGAIIKVIGIGGGGNNAVNNMFHTGIKGVHFVACNTDAQALQASPLGTKIQLGAQGLGAGCDPEQGKQAALESMDKICEMLDNNTQMVFLAAGMGGGTGTGATPVIAKMAKEMGVLTVAIVTMPFSNEGSDFTRRAREGILELQRYVDSLLMINNDRLFEFHGELPVKKAFAKADEVLTTAVKGIAEIITRTGYTNVDFADVSRAMKNSSVAVMGSGVASGEKRALRAAEEALSSPLLDNNDISGAKSVLVNIAASEDTFMMSELGQALNYIQERTGRTAQFVKHGMIFDNALEDAMHITIVATGFRMAPFADKFGDDNEEGEVITLNGDEFSEKDIIPIIGNEEKMPATEQAEPDIMLDTSRRVFENDDPTPATITKIRAKPVLLLDEESDKSEFRKTPAYIRRKVIINTPGDNSNTSASTLTETAAGGHHLSTDNSYLHQQLD